MVMVMMYGEAGGSRGRQDLGITDDVDEEMLIPASDSLFGFSFRRGCLVLHSCAQLRHKPPAEVQKTLVETWFSS